MQISKPYRVLLLARELGPGGSERQLTEMAKSMDRSRYSPMVGYFRPGIRLAELQDAGVPCHQIPIASFRSLRAAREAYRFSHYLRANSIAIVHTFDYPLTCFAVPLARAAGVPVILSSQRSMRDLIPQSYRKLVRFTDRLAHGIVVNCQAIATHLTADEQIPARKVHLCYNGLDVAAFSNHPVSVFRHDGVCRIGSVCVFRPEKNLELLLHAVARVVKIVRNLELHLTGSGPEEIHLKRTARKLGIDVLCHFHGPQSDVARAYGSLNVFVLPSHTEALSNSLMEAMASGCAVIASNVGGNSELVQHDRTGLLFESGNLDELTRYLLLLARDPERRLRLGHNAQQFVGRHFTLAGAAETMTKIYDSMLAGYRQDRRKPEMDA